MTRFKDRERITKAAKEKQVKLPTREHPLDCHLISQQKHFRPERVVRNIQDDKKKGPTAKVTLLSKSII